MHVFLVYLVSQRLIFLGALAVYMRITIIYSINNIIYMPNKIFHRASIILTGQYNLNTR